LPLL
jgi:hypothetical protein